MEQYVVAKMHSHITRQSSNHIDILVGWWVGGWVGKLIYTGEAFSQWLLFQAPETVQCRTKTNKQKNKNKQQDKKQTQKIKSKQQEKIQNVYVACTIKHATYWICIGVLQLLLWDVCFLPSLDSSHSMVLFIH